MVQAVTLEGPVVLLPADDYQKLLERISRLEHMMGYLLQSVEDQEDIQAMREAEAEWLLEKAARPLLDFPVDYYGPWPENLSLRREDLYDDWGR
jgi:hypothetical protein